jgi:hypothetical protein
MHRIEVGYLPIFYRDEGEGICRRPPVGAIVAARS